MNRSFWHHKPADRNRYLSFRVKLIEETNEIGKLKNGLINYLKK